MNKIIIGSILAMAFFILALLSFVHIGSAHERHCGKNCKPYECVNDDCVIVPSITITPEVDPTATPEATSTPEIIYGLPGDGKSDGRSDGLSSCPQCTESPKTDSYPKSNFDGSNVGWK